MATSEDFETERNIIKNRGRVYDLTLDVMAEDAGESLPRHGKPKTEREIVEFLFNLLDDIDTTGDIAKSDDAGYRAAVERIQKRRWESGIRTDGYKLYHPGESMPKDNSVPQQAVKG